MEVKKFVRTTEVVRLPGGSDTVTEGNKSLATNAWNEFLRKETVEVKEGEKYVPFHAIDHVTVTGENKTEEVEDDTCDGGESPEPPDPPVPPEPVITFTGIPSFFEINGSLVDGTVYDFYTDSGVKAFKDGVEIPIDDIMPPHVGVCFDEPGYVTFTAEGVSQGAPYHVYAPSPPQISGLHDFTVSVGEVFDVLEGVTATDCWGNPINVTCDAPSSYEEPGTYTIAYYAEDKCGLSIEIPKTVTVIDTAIRSTVIYVDGTLIINELDTDRDRNIMLYGQPIGDFEPYDGTNYVLSSGAGQPWYHYQSQIREVEFGSRVAPTDMSYWFQNCGITNIDWTNFDGSRVESIRATFSGTRISGMTVPAMPNLTNLRYAFRGCPNLQSVDMSNVGAYSIVNTQDMFQGCYALTEADLSGIGGFVTNSERMFANINEDGMGNMNIRTIYATADLIFTRATAGNMFRSCVYLSGAMPFNPSYVDATYANINGYFTAK